MASSTRATYKVTHPEGLPKAVDPLVGGVARGVLSDTVANTPSETGTLARGWRLVHQRDNQWDITNDVPYAKHVEFGTRGRTAAAMLGRAVASARARYGKARR